MISSMNCVILSRFIAIAGLLVRSMSEAGDTDLALPVQSVEVERSIGEA